MSAAPIQVHQAARGPCITGAGLQRIAFSIVTSEADALPDGVYQVRIPGERFTAFRPLH